MWFAVAHFLVLESCSAPVHETQVSVLLQTSNKTNALFWSAGFTCLFLAALGLCCCAWLSLVTVSWGYALDLVLRPLIAAASFAAGHGL